MARSVSAARRARGYVALGGFLPVTGAALGAVVESALVTLSNLAGTVPLTISGGSYSKNGAAYSTAATTVANGDTVKVRVTAPTRAGSAVTAIVTIAGAARRFTVTTAAPVVTNPGATEVSVFTISGPTSVAEGNSGNTSLIFTVTRSGFTDGAGSVAWSKSGTTVAADFASGQTFSGTLAYAAGETTKMIVFSVLGDTDVEGDETVIVTLSDPKTIGSVAGSPITATVTNDDVGQTLIMALAASRGLYPGQQSAGGFSNGTETSETTQAMFRTGPDPIPAGTMRAVYVNSTNKPPETSGISPVRTKAALRLGPGSSTPPLGSSAMITVPVDGLGVITPPNQPEMAAQSPVWIRSYAEVDAGGKWPMGRPLVNSRNNPGNVSNTEFGEGSNRTTFGFNDPNNTTFTSSGVYQPANQGSDRTDDATALTGSNSGGFGWAPSAILGMVPATSKRAVVISDSIGVGSGDTAAFYADRQAGFVNHTLARLAIPYINLGASGDGTSGWLTDRSRRVAFINLCRPNFVISQIVTNTLGTGLTYNLMVNGQMIPTWIAMKALCGGGMPVYQLACLPRTNGTNTAPAYTNDATTRQAFNLWGRDGCPLNPSDMTAQPVGTANSATCIRIGNANHPLAGFVDIATDVEDLSTGLWKISGYGDGLHPSQAGHALIASQTALTNFNPQIQAYVP